MPSNRCSNCVSYRLECTYVEAAKVCATPLYPYSVSVGISSAAPPEARASQRVRVVISFSPVHPLSHAWDEHSYVESLETRLEKMEKLLNKVRTGYNLVLGAIPTYPDFRAALSQCRLYERARRVV